MRRVAEQRGQRVLWPGGEYGAACLLNGEVIEGEPERNVQRAGHEPPAR